MKELWLLAESLHGGSQWQVGSATEAIRIKTSVEPAMPYAILKQRSRPIGEQLDYRKEMYWTSKYRSVYTAVQRDRDAETRSIAEPLFLLGLPKSRLSATKTQRGR